MAAAARAHGAPVHLWIVAIAALLWNAFGCYDYLMTQMQNPAYLANFSADQRMYFERLPAWLTAFWALGVWGGLAGALSLLARSRHATWAFALSLIGAAVTFAYEAFATDIPASMKQGATAFIPWLIVAIAALLLGYSLAQARKRVLR